MVHQDVSAGQRDLSGGGQSAAARPSVLNEMSGNDADLLARRPETPGGQLKLLTLNCLGVPFVRRTRSRLGAIAREVDAGDADVVCLQEIQLRHYVPLLDQGLSRYPHVAFEPFLYAPKGGLLTFSRLPIGDTTFELFPERGDWHRPSVADRILHKGLLATEIEVEGHTVVVINTHLTANYDADWSPSNRYARLEAAQLRHVADYVASVSREHTVIVAGDFNVPRHSQIYDDFVQSLGLVDPLEGDTKPTYEPLLRLPERYVQPLDHVLVRSPLVGGPALTARLAFAHDVPLMNGAVGRVSDHVGIELTIDWRAG